MIKLVKNLKDISQKDWEELNESEGDGPNLLILVKGGLKEKLKANYIDLLEEKFYELHDEYNELTGGKHQLEKILILMQKRIEMRVKVARGDKSAKNWINLYSAMLDELTKKDDDFNHVKMRMSVQQAYGMPINIKEVSAYEFIQITNLVQEQASQKSTNTPTDGED